MDNDASGYTGSPGAQWNAGAAGIFTWDINSNTLYGDAVVADLFDLDTAMAMKGLPLQDYLAGMHPDDRQGVARAIHTAILSGEPYQEEYRLQRPGGGYIWVLAIGHCFRNHEGTPSIYSGVIYDVTEQKTSTTDGLSDHCRAALAVARRLDNPRLIELLNKAIAEASREDRRDILSRSVWH